jgi:hypothetical protein
MVTMLGRHVNKSVLVSIPPVFGSDELHQCQLVGIESGGLWLESSGLARIAFDNAEAAPIAVFVPFTQIAYLIGAPGASPANKPKSATVSAESATPSRKAPARVPQKRRRQVAKS